MGIWDRFLGDNIAKPIEAVGNIIDDVWDSDEELMTKQAVLDRIKNSPYLAALEIAMVEAKSDDPWTSRARPMILYTFCAVFFIDKGMAPMMFWLLQIFHSSAIPPPQSVLDSGVIMTAVAGVLGLGWIVSRGKEKIAGAA